jgi:hypothetical protein
METVNLAATRFQLSFFNRKVSRPATHESQLKVGQEEKQTPLRVTPGLLKKSRTSPGLPDHLNFLIG